MKTCVHARPEDPRGGAGYHAKLVAISHSSFQYLLAHRVLYQVVGVHCGLKASGDGPLSPMQQHAFFFAKGSRIDVLAPVLAI